MMDLPTTTNKKACDPLIKRSFDDEKIAPAAPRATWFTFYSHRAQREYYYNPASGVSSWQLPADGVISRLPGSPVQSPLSPQESKIPNLDLLFPLPTHRALGEENQGCGAKMSEHRLIPIITKPRVALALFLANLVLLTICCCNFGLTAVMLRDNNTTNRNSTIISIPHHVPKQENKVSERMTDTDACWVDTSKKTVEESDTADDWDDREDKANIVNSGLEGVSPEPSIVGPLGGGGEDFARPGINVVDKDNCDDSSRQHRFETAPDIDKEPPPETNTGDATPLLAKDVDSFGHFKGQESESPVHSPSGKEAKQKEESVSSNDASIDDDTSHASPVNEGESEELSTCDYNTIDRGSTILRDIASGSNSVFENNRNIGEEQTEQYANRDISASPNGEGSADFSDEGETQKSEIVADKDEVEGKPPNDDSIDDNTSADSPVEKDDTEELLKSEYNTIDHGSTMLHGNPIIGEQQKDSAVSINAPTSNHERQSNEESKTTYDSGSGDPLESDKRVILEADPDHEEPCVEGSENVSEIALLVEAAEILIHKTSILLERIIHDANSAGYSIDLKPKVVL